MSDATAAYIDQLFRTLSSNPTAQDLDLLVEGYTRVGYLAAQAEGDAEMAEAERKFHEATAYSEAKSGSPGERVTDEAAKNLAYLRTYDYRKAEIKAREKAQKLKNLLGSCEQAIMAIKFLGRYEVSPSPTIRGPRA